MMNEEVRRIMTTDHLTVRPDQSVQEVTNLMLKNKLQQIPVVNEKNQLVGLVTSYDLWRNTKQGDLSFEQKVSEVMTSQVLSITPKDKVGTAAQLFADKRFKTLPVVNLRGELKGIVTAFDVIRQAYLAEYPDPILYKDEFMKQP